MRHTTTMIRVRRAIAALLAGVALTASVAVTPAFAPDGPDWMPAHAAATK
jgi:hypothetical protein